MLFFSLLDKIPFFWEFTAEEKSLFAANDNFFATFKDKEYLITEGDTNDDALFILIKGRADVTMKRTPDQVLATLESGSIVGEISYLTKRKRATNIVADGEVIAFRINHDTLEKEHVDPALVAKINKQLVEILVCRLEETNKSLASQKEANKVLINALRAKSLG
jgi:CRP/FNR family transcriptional regulator, cyclic AMP receptor protein